MLKLLIVVSALCGATAERPVAKVVRLLNDMKAQLEKEAEEDEEVMEKMECWCTHGEAQKTAAISSNTAAVASLETAIEEYTAQGQQLAKDIKQLTKDIDSNKQELLEATTMRDKDRAEYVQDEKEQLVSLEGVKNALSAIKAGVALPQTALLQVRGALKKRKKFQNARVQSFLQMKESTQAPASSEIIGILKQMKDDFENSLKSSATEEKTAEKAYSGLKAAKEGELKAATEQLDAKESQAAEAASNAAQASTDLKLAKAAIEEDTEFLATLKDKCASMDAEFAARKKVRAEEITAVGETLAILTSDESRDAFGKTGSFIEEAFGFIQTKSVTSTETAARQQASKLLLELAVKTGSPKLSTLAVRVRADVFDKVKKAIDELTVQLKKENADEIKHRDYCIKALNDNARATDAAYHDQHRSQTKHDELEVLLKNGGDEIAALQKEIHETQISMMKATEVRKEENKDFGVTIQDQRATQAILTKALDRLKAFYAKKGALVQVSAAQPSFKEYKKSGGATGVMGMIQGIIDESKAVETDAIAAEMSSQTAYEGFIKDSNKSITLLTKALTAKTEAVAKAEAEITSVKADLLASLETLEDLSAYSKEVHLDCDYTLKNFDARQAARATEIDALFQAKSIISGAR
eukprot:gnl/MRDRNA2_/MRDRNA2_89583_c0_seq1.p1 gnl/MRDRNA2_/MRDRNA2_89583_c0~~gnl/MRDRNA2_/MRDRNA2_89583_c0_seq1.p1  ORF type:complete len:641 (-),score=216.85 gnl/MRDRNA2_/MRDRNA2_89583_c0_seq1:22-1944(-)